MPRATVFRNPNVLRALLPDGVIKSTFVVLCCLAAPVTAQNLPCTSDQRAEYLQMLQNKISTNWRLPSHYQAVNCTVLISQSFRGEVLNAAVQGCTDPEIVKSIENATYLSSPLPLPRNDSCFERRIEVQVVRKPG